MSNPPTLPCACSRKQGGEKNTGNSCTKVAATTATRGTTEIVTTTMRTIVNALRTRTFSSLQGNSFRSPTSNSHFNTVGNKSCFKIYLPNLLRVAGLSTRTEPPTSLVPGLSQDEAEKLMHKLNTGDYFLLSFTCTHGETPAGEKPEQGFVCPKTGAEKKVNKAVSKQAYREGVVLAKCPCEKLHLIADNLGWFGDQKNVEQILAQKQQAIQKLTIENKFSIA